MITSMVSMHVATPPVLQALWQQEVHADADRSGSHARLNNSWST
jgi:hypothetical protein